MSDPHDYAEGRLEARRQELADRHAQGGDCLGGREPHHELVLGATTDDGVLVAILPDPNNALRVDEDFLALHILK